ncbi:hypothetical protein G9A89_000290, partial [Geosiphon pyriformis]
RQSALCESRGVVNWVGQVVNESSVDRFGSVGVVKRPTLKANGGTSPNESCGNNRILYLNEICGRLYSESSVLTQRFLEWSLILDEALRRLITGSFGRKELLMSKQAHRQFLNALTSRAGQDHKDEEMSTTLKVFKFGSMDRTKWRECKIKTLAYARRKGFSEAFTKKYDNDELKIKANILKRDMAIDYLISSLTESAFTKVTSLTTEDPCTAWSILHAYKSCKEEHLKSVQVELSNLKMGKTEEPDDFFNKLLLINERLSKISKKYKLDNLQMKIHLLAKLPEEYQVTKKAIQVNGIAKKDIEDLVKELNQVWKEKGYDKTTTKDDTNGALFPAFCLVWGVLTAIPLSCGSSAMYPPKSSAAEPSSPRVAGPPLPVF